MHHLPSRYIPCDGRLTASAYFKSTLPAWGATQHGVLSLRSQADFNPRSPHGERPVRRTVYPNPPQFQSTPPAWGATKWTPVLSPAYTFQSTLPAWGATMFIKMTLVKNGFQSTLPAWGATPKFSRVRLSYAISIHAPRTGSDIIARICSRVSNANFNPRSPHGERR